jgi:hypothetical protein
MTSIRWHCSTASGSDSPCRKRRAAVTPEDSVRLGSKFEDHDITKTLRRSTTSLSAEPVRRVPWWSVGSRSARRWPFSCCRRKRVFKAANSSNSTSLKSVGNSSITAGCRSSGVACSCRTSPTTDVVHPASRLWRDGHRRRQGTEKAARACRRLTAPADRSGGCASRRRSAASAWSRRPERARSEQLHGVKTDAPTHGPASAHSLRQSRLNLQLPNPPYQRCMSQCTERMPPGLQMTQSACPTAR